MRQKMRFRGHLLLLVLWFVVQVCNARPQSRGEPGTDVDSQSPSSDGARLTNEERAFFAPGSWQPIPSHFSGLIIDEAPSRVRVEKYDSSQRDARSKEQSVETPPPAVQPSNNATDNTTTRGKSPTPLGDAIKMVASQLLQSRGAVAESDVRAPPPKVKQQQKHEESQPSKLKQQETLPSKLKQQETLPSKLKQKVQKQEEEMSHEGVAIPVIIEEDAETQTTAHKKTHTTTSPKKQQQATTKKPTPASLRHPVTSIPDGLTTWVFLSGSSAESLVATTPSPVLSTRLSTATTAKKTQRTTTTTTPTPKTSHNVVKKPSPLFTSSGTKPNRMTKKPVVTEETATVKTKNKEEMKPTASRLEEGIAFRRRPVSSAEVEASPSTTTTTTFKPLPTAYPLSTVAAVAAVDEGSGEAASSSEEDVSVEDIATTTKPKKKKKNKNKRRRRPVVKPQEEEEDDDSAELESKIDEEIEGLTKTPVKGKPSRPLTTRIYNYLAREIMPSVGVGLIGLVGLAGLAGLIMYPFGGGALPIRRNYNAAATPKPNYYYYENDEGGQSEEEVLGKVLAGMKDPSYVVGGGSGEASSYQPEQPESRTPIQQGEAYTRYDVGRIQETSQPIRSDYDAAGRIKETSQPIRSDYDAAGRIKETSQPIRSDYDVAGRIPPVTKNYRRQEEEYESEIGSRVSGGVRLGDDVRGGQIKEAVIQDETHYGGVEAAVTGGRAPVQNRVSQSDAPQASALYATRNEPRPVFNNDWSMVKTDAQEAVSTNNNNHNHHHELKYSGGDDADAIYGQQQQQQREERFGYESPQYSGVSRVGVGQKRTVEHGPRRLRRDVIKKDAAVEDLAENEIIGLEVSDEPVYTVERVQVEENTDDDDEEEEKATKTPPKKDLGLALKKTTTPTTKLDVVDMETTTDGKVITEINTDSSEIYTDSSEETNEGSDERIDVVETPTTTTRNVDVVVNSIDDDSVKIETMTTYPPDVTTSTEENITLETESPEDPSLVGLIRRVAQYKIRLGLSFLRNTSQAFSRYLEGMQKKVEEIVKENAKNRNRLQKRKSAHEEYY